MGGVVMDQPDGVPNIEAEGMTDAVSLPPGSQFRLPPRLTEDELAQHWRLTRRTLQRWRAAGKGPAWMRLGGRVLYRLEDVRAFEAAELNGPAI